MKTSINKDVLKEEMLKRNKIIFQKKKVEFSYDIKSNSNEIADLISDKLLAIIKKNVC